MTVLSLLLTGLANGMADENPSSEETRSRIEVVFVLDTTGSMGGLIEGAKQKIWAIAKTLASAKPVPRIKMGLVGFRDRPDAYVTKLTQLTEDLDGVYKELMSLHAGGGGDMPESVNQALHEAVTAIQWSDDKETYRVIFLVGDSPPHMDYAGDVKHRTTCKLAGELGIIVNTIQCGRNAATEPIWREIAQRAHGRYLRVDQSGGVVVRETPYDDELVRLSAELDATRVYYGSRQRRAEGQRRKEAADEVLARAPASARADRAIFNAGAAGSENFLGEGELLDDVRTGRVKLADLKAESLPEPLQKMSPKERAAFVKEQTAKRADLRKKINDLAQKRNRHIKDQIAKADVKGDSGFDGAVVACLKEQAGKKNIKITGP